MRADSYERSLKLLTLNVCGLKSKLCIPEFQSFISNFDLIGFQETFCDDYDSLDLEGYNVLVKNRKHRMKKKSGGIALAYKKCFEQYIKYVESDSKLVLWFQLSDRLTKKGNWLCGVVYIPPENSIYAVENPYGEIENEMRRLSVNCSSVIILGDLNSRSKNLQDYIIPDNEIFDNLSLNDIFEELQSEFLCFKNSPFRLHRQNSDTGVNNFGYRLVDFCIDNDMFIMNGRGDSNSSDIICKNVSTVDYFLLSRTVISMSECLTVHEFCEFFSDSHKPVSLVVKIGYCHTCPDISIDKTQRTKLWDAEKAQTFINNFNNDDIYQLCGRLDNLSSQNDVSQGDVNEIINSLNDIYLSNCRSSFGTISPKNQTGQTKNDSWFTKDCKTARKHFHSAKHQINCAKIMKINVV